MICVCSCSSSKKTITRWFISYGSQEVIVLLLSFCLFFMESKTPQINHFFAFLTKLLNALLICYM